MLGLLLLVAELFIPTGFYLCIVALAALATGLLVLIGIGGPAWVQWLLCAVLSGVFVLWLRKQLLGRRVCGTDAVLDRGPVGEEVLVRGVIPPGEVGEGEFRGTRWSVRNAGTTPIDAGERCRVQKVEGLTLIVGG